MSQDEPYRVPAVVSAIRALEVLEGLNGTGASLSEIARRIDRSKSTVFNLLTTLESEGFLYRDPVSLWFHLGPRLIPLGAAAAREARPLAAAVAAARNLSAETGMSVAIVQALAEGTAQAVERATPPRGVHVGITVGDRYGIFDGAVGKALLAGMRAGDAEEAIRNGTPYRHTERTITDVDDLIEEITVVRRRGWASSVAELNENHAVSAPVFGPSGETLLILVVMAFPSQLPESQIPALGERLRRVADAVTVECGGTPRHAARVPATTG
ncbi:MAG: IclR family transcriptional regulator [Thermoleophilia bacterium]